MTLPSSGTISLGQIATEFSDSQPNSMSEFYRNGSLVPSSKTVTQSFTASQSGGGNGTGDGNGGPSGGTGIYNQIVFPANATVDQTINWSWAVTNGVWSNWGKPPNAEQSYYQSFSGSYSLTVGSTTHTASGGQDQLPSNPALQYQPHTLTWYVSSGSGIAITNYTGQNVDFSNWSSRGDSLPVTTFQNGTFAITPTNPPTSYSGASVSVSDASASGSFKFAGTSGNSGCTIRLLFAFRLNDPGWWGWGPTNLGSITGTRQVTSNINQNVPTSGAINIGNFYGAEDN
tara:strand:- start:87 stop:947 length:861 start_codon:yes stop_codon:yes gene_type:complete